MANRFFSNDSTTWIGPTHIGQGKGARSVSKFIFKGEEGSPVEKLRASFEAAHEAMNGLREQRKTVEATGKYLPLGISEALAKHATEDNIPKLRRAKATVEKIKAEIADRRSKLTLPKPNEEQRRDFEEVRAAMRSMAPADRERFLKENRTDPTVSAAIATAIPGLSGINPVAHQNIIAEVIGRVHGEAIEEITDLEEVLKVTEKVTDLAREELREILGVDRDTFEQIAQVGERNGGRLPFKVEVEVQNGQVVEIAQVLDVQTKTWRRASAEEIMATRSDAAAA